MGKSLLQSVKDELMRREVEREESDLKNCEQSLRKTGFTSTFYKETAKYFEKDGFVVSRVRVPLSEKWYWDISVPKE